MRILGYRTSNDEAATVSDEEEPARLLGALLVSQFTQAAEARSDTEERERRDYTLYIDEFQNFASLAFAKILSEARKWHLSIVRAHQF
jgi:hypothetical protein